MILMIFWTAAKASYVVLLCRMEQGEISEYTQTDLVDRVRRAHAQRHIVPTASNSSQNVRKSENTKSMACNFYNQGTCNHSATHKTNGVLYKHICSFCFSKGGKNFAHPETDYRSKNKQAQNELIWAWVAILKKLTTTRQIWSNINDKKIAVKELSADQNAISQWFKGGNDFANIWNGRSYAQVVGEERQLPVSAACILQTPDRKANAKKVKGFLKVNKPVTFNATSSTHAESSTQCADNTV